MGEFLDGRLIVFVDEEEDDEQGNDANPQEDGALREANITGALIMPVRVILTVQIRHF
jgi:hypothetical protein